MNRTFAPRLVLTAALALAASLTAAQPGGLPQRNLLVELRQTDEANVQREGAGVHGGSLTIDAGGGVRGGVGVGAEARSRDAASDSVQQVRVLNGGRAGVRLARSTPLEFVQVLWTPQGAQVLPSTTWTETGLGFNVQPRWPGGQAPVTVEVSAETGGALASGPGGATERGQLLTTVQLPLGEWVTIASTAGSSSERRSGTLSTRDVDRSRSQVVQMRVTAP
jgi:hypothetical protein